MTSKYSGSEVVTRLIIWSTHVELLLQTVRRTVTIGQSSTLQRQDMISMLNVVDLGYYARIYASRAIHNGVPQEVLDT